MSVIDFAVNHLKVKHIVVCGHSFCGGVNAAMQNQDFGILNPWLKNVRDVYRIHKEELDAIPDEDKRYRRLIELNVEEQCYNVLNIPSVQESFDKAGYPLVHGWIFDIKTGELIDLKSDFQGNSEDF
jgi:carbonic anhydrase